VTKHAFTQRIFAACLHVLGRGSHGERFKSEPWALIYDADLQAFRQWQTQHIRQTEGAE
jgi:hypothetical protein